MALAAPSISADAVTTNFDSLIVLSGWRIGRRQLDLSYDEQGLFLRDAGGMSPVRVNGNAVQEYGPLASNDVIELGDYKVRAHPTREAFDAELADAVADSTPDLVVCAGYLRILGLAFVERFRGRLINIHPSLLPKYRGLRTHARALEAGEREHGASVHFVTPELDAGAVIAQATVPVLDGDTADSLARRVLQAEHPLLVAVTRLALSGRLAEHAATVLLDGHPLFTPLRLTSTGMLSEETA
jgi:phosphoribosylglycinamide formyltransferase-1